jgi:hypothetical protein
MRSLKTPAQVEAELRDVIDAAQLLVDSYAEQRFSLSGLIYDLDAKLHILIGKRKRKPSKA